MMLTIITPTYNRKNLLNKLYDSLKNQTSHEFEWIIVDDGSSDGTKENVKSIKESATIDINYIYKENGGKHTAINVGVKHAKGELITIIDSDDTLLPDAVETINSDWLKYKDNKSLAGLSYKRKLINPIATATKNDTVEGISNPIKIANDGIQQDRAFVYRREVWLEFPFPEIKGENFLREACFFYDVARKYDTLYINKEVRVTEYMNDGLTYNIFKKEITNPKGEMINHEKMLLKDFKLSIRLREAIVYNAFANFAKVNFFNRLPTGKKFIVTITKIPGDLLYIKWRKRYDEVQKNDNKQGMKR